LKKQSWTIALDHNSNFVEADVVWGAIGWQQYRISSTPARIGTEEYFVPSAPVDIHCHGIGNLDFSDLRPHELMRVNEIARERGLLIVATIFLRPQLFRNFLELMDEFHLLKKRGLMTNILGIGVEGPLLASTGGTPKSGSWRPSLSQWRDFARCGDKGLLYIVLSPDVHLWHQSEDPILDPDILDIVAVLVAGGVRPSIGHYSKRDPEMSAAATVRMIERVEAVSGGRSANALLTDHMFNDMPRNFKHAWRSHSEKAVRQAEVASIENDAWTWDNLVEKLGPVPAALLNAARECRITLSLNFDGEHVDPVIYKKTLDLVGADNVVAMTDSIEVDHMAGEQLQSQPGSSLRFQSEGIVAAGSTNMRKQIRAMIQAGVEQAAVWKCASYVPLRFTGTTSRHLAGRFGTSVSPALGVRSVYQQGSSDPASIANHYNA